MKIIASTTAAFLVGTSYYAQAAKVGDEVCATGYVMDNFCIDRGTLLDAPSVVTLKNPEEHSFHCLLDVPVCFNSGFALLGEKDAATDLHSVAFQLDDTNAPILEAGRALGSETGSCTECTSTMADAPSKGYRATLKGKVTELGDGTVAPTLMLTEILDSSVACPVMTEAEPVTLPEPEPVDEPVAAEPDTADEPAAAEPDTVDEPAATEPDTVDEPASEEPADESSAHVVTIAATSALLVLSVSVLL